ncbi:hypothetical protein BGZ81_009958 [Podila clonocystis]|nr:hypothetical protein BGZ81_009958 [Podila clonocystis]
MTTASIFDIHFLQEVICQELSPRDLQHCVLVCRAWCINFEPYLFLVITIRTRSAFGKITSPKLRIKLARYADCIQTIENVYIAAWPAFLALPLNNLRVLKCSNPKNRCIPWSDDMARNNYLTAILTAAPNLHTLKLDVFSGSLRTTIPETHAACENKATALALLAAIRNHPSLRKISVTSSNPYQIPKTSMGKLGMLLWACHRLESVTINLRIGHRHYRNNAFEDDFNLLRRTHEIASLSAPPILALKELNLSGVFKHVYGERLLGLLKMYPNLERFTLPSLIAMGLVVSEIAHTLPTAWRYLQHLDLRASNLSPHNMAMLFDCFSSLKSVAGIGAVFPHASNGLKEVTTALLKHGETLEVQDLVGKGLPGIMGWLVHRLLCACPNLREMHALGAEVTRGRRWINLDPIMSAAMMKLGADQSDDWAAGLKVLRIQCQESFARDVDIFPHTLLSHLGKMTQLEELGLGRVTRAQQQNYGEPGSVLEPARRTVSTLAVLSTMKQLRRLELRNIKEYIDPADLSKAKEQWGRIEVRCL